jgi:hypothetical protein
VTKEYSAYDVVCWGDHCRIEHGKCDVEVINLSKQCDYYEGEKEIYKPVLYIQGVWSPQSHPQYKTHLELVLTTNAGYDTCTQALCTTHAKASNKAANSDVR